MEIECKKCGEVYLIEIKLVNSLKFNLCCECGCDKFQDPTYK